MKIIIEVDGAQGQPEIRRETSTVTEQQSVVNAPVGISSSAINAGEPRVGDGFRNDSSTVVDVQSLQGSSSSSGTGSIDAGAAKVQDVSSPAMAMPDTGNMETFNPANAFSAGALANPVSN